MKIGFQNKKKNNQQVFSTIQTKQKKIYILLIYTCYLFFSKKTARLNLIKKIIPKNK